MTGFERYQRTLAGDVPDFVARVPILMQFAAEYIGSNYGAFASDCRVLVEANVACAREFGMDQVSAISDPYRETQGFGGKIEYVRDGAPRSTHPLQAAKDFSRLATPDPLTSERMRDRVDAVRAFKEQCGGEYSILGWVEGPAAEAANLRGVSEFLMDLLIDEPFVIDLMDRCVEVGIAFAEAQIAAGADTVGVGDAICSQVSPDMYERLIQPREKKLIRAIQAAGARAKLHICGNTTHLLPGIGGLGADIVDADHMVDLAAVRAAVGKSATITGNIDPARAVHGGTPESIIEKMRQCYEAAGNPFMVNAGCEIPSGTPHENLKALCEPMAYRP